MTENKAGKALKKVTINFTNNPNDTLVASEDEMFRIDISDQLPDSYYLDSITVDRDGTGHTIEFIEKDVLRGIVSDIETILDATLVNAKQRESVGKLIRNCVYRPRGRWAM